MTIAYTCCGCGGTHAATPADVASAMAQCPGTPAEAAFLCYGRDLCPRCTMTYYLTFEPGPATPLTTKHGARIA